MRVSFILALAWPAFVILPAAAAQSFMVGTWYGHGQPENPDSMYIDRMRADGSWRGEYRTCVRGKARDEVQEGRWALAGDTLSLRVEMVNGANAPRTDIYQMLWHSPTAQKYISQGWNFPYAPQRVADDFQMPGCDLVS
jgi:hypothetical protein